MYIVSNICPIKFNKEHSLRYGFKLWMILTVIAIESLPIKLHNNKNIKGIKLPNLRKEFITLLLMTTPTTFRQIIYGLWQSKRI